MNFDLRLKHYSFLSAASEIASDLSIQVFIIGGFVRDLIINREISEIDFLVLGNGVEFAERYAEKLVVKNISVFRNFGTAHFRHEDYDLEFVGARKESYNRDSRKPEVFTGSFLDDINRRDFTINTLAISLNKEDYGELIDTYEGIKDLENKLIKTPVDPLITFDDDPLRIMRAFRFASQLNFRVDESITIAANQLKERLKIVSQERITDEFLKILSSEGPSIGMIHMYKTGVLEVIFPELANLAGVDQRKDFHHKDVFFHTCKVMENISKMTDNIWLRFAALVHDIAKPQTKKFVEDIGWTFHGHEELGARMIKPIFKRMKLPFNKIEYVEKLVRLHLRPIALAKEEVTDSAIRRLIVSSGEDLGDLILLCRADITSKNQDKVNRYLENYERVMKKVWEIEDKDKLRSFQSPVNGEEIMRICNLTPSRKVGEIKSAIEEAILDGKIGNNYEEALGYLMEIKGSFLR